MPRYLIVPDPGAPVTGDQLTGVVIQAADPQRAAVRYARRQAPTGPTPTAGQPRDLLVLPFPAGIKMRTGVAAWETATPDDALVVDQVPDQDA